MYIFRNNVLLKISFILEMEEHKFILVSVLPCENLASEKGANERPFWKKSKSIALLQSEVLFCTQAALLSITINIQLS